jgi:hypothetical protein
MSPDTLDRYVDAGVLPQPKIRGGLKRFRWAEVEAALETGAASIVTFAGEDTFDERVRGAQAASGPASEIRPASRRQRA